MRQRRRLHPAALAGSNRLPPRCWSGAGSPPCFIFHIKILHCIKATPSIHPPIHLVNAYSALRVAGFAGVHLSRFYSTGATSGQFITGADTERQTTVGAHAYGLLRRWVEAGASGAPGGKSRTRSENMLGLEIELATLKTCSNPTLAKMQN